jgi:hypothetical protein
MQERRSAASASRFPYHVAAAGLPPETPGHRDIPFIGLEE